MASTNRPLAEFRAGRGAKVVIWKNEENLAFQIQPPQYKNDNGEWKQGNFFDTDLPGIIHAIERALRFANDNEKGVFKDTNE
jgi:hypothetical protein